MLLQESFQNWNSVFSWFYFTSRVFLQTFCKIYANKMKRISRKDFETYERIKQFMIEHKFIEEDLRRYVKHEVHLEVSSKGMEPTKFESLNDAATFMGFQSKLLLTLISIRNTLSLREKGKTKYSSSSGLRKHNIYPSWINIYLLGAGIFSKNLSKNFTSKMPHSNFKRRMSSFVMGILMCSYGQAFK